MIDLDMARNDNERLALSLLKSMEDGNLTETIKAICTEDFEWANSGLPTLQGQAEIFAHMESGGFAQMIPILKDMACLIQRRRNPARQFRQHRLHRAR